MQLTWSLHWRHFRKTKGADWVHTSSSCVHTESLCMCRCGLRKKASVFTLLCVRVSPSAGRKPDMKFVGEMIHALLPPAPTPGWVQARCRHFRGGPEERSADPPRSGHPSHRLQQAAQRAEAENLRLEGVSAAGAVSTTFQISAC